MITGDNPLTACHVAKELRFAQKSGGILVLTTDESKNWFWESIDQTLKLPLVADKSYKELVQKYDLTLTGEVSAVLEILTVSEIWLLEISVFFLVSYLSYQFTLTANN